VARRRLSQSPKRQTTLFPTREPIDMMDGMRPPPIRYPLPSLLLLVLGGLLIWRGEVWTRPLRTSLTDRWERLTYGPPVPHSDRPKRQGSITRRGLLLREDVPVFDRPKGTPLEPIASRSIVSLYDTWSAVAANDAGSADFFRVGTTVPIGWVAASDLLPWNTRLVLLCDSGGSGAELRPVVGWKGSDVETASWPDSARWLGSMRREWASLSDVPPERRGVLIAQVELPALLRLAIASKTPELRSRARMRAITGDLLDDPNWSDEEIKAAWTALPAWAAANSSASPETAIARLAEINSSPAVAVAWGDRKFVFVPLDALP
jgi:hypothetical protein